MFGNALQTAYVTILANTADTMIAEVESAQGRVG